MAIVQPQWLGAVWRRVPQAGSNESDEEPLGPFREAPEWAARPQGHENQRSQSRPRAIRGSFEGKQGIRYPEGRAHTRQLSPFVHWGVCSKASLGPGRPSFIGEASPEVFPTPESISCHPEPVRVRPKRPV